MLGSAAPTESLTIIYSDLDFLACAKDNEKPCFRTRTYEDKNSWIGAAKRWLASEAQEISGISEMGRISRNAAQNYNQYMHDKNFGPPLKTRIIGARKGLERIARTYESIGRSVTASNIRNGPIMTLDNLLPHDDKVREGFVNIIPIPQPPLVIEDHVEDVPLDDC
jgi:hypothetical protein